MTKKKANKEVKEISVFERIGGKVAVNQAVDIFYERLLNDESINSFFKNTDMESQRGKQKGFLTMALGGPVKYTGKNMRDAHSALVENGLNEEHFNSVANHLVETLKAIKVNQTEIDEIAKIVQSTKNDVFGISNQTKGTIKDNKMTTKTQDAQVAANGTHTNGVSVEQLNLKLQKLESAEGIMRQSLEQAIDSVVTINSDRLVTFYNRAAEKMFGYSKSEILGQNVKKIVPIEHQANHDNYVNDNIRTGVNKVVGVGRELEMVRKDGSRFWGNLSLSKVEMEGNVQYTAFIKDITAEREAKLRASQIQTAVDAGWASIEFSPEGIIQEVNDNWVKNLGYQRNEMIGQHHRMFCEEVYANSNEYRAFWNDLANGIIKSGEFKRLKNGNQELWINASYTPVKDENGKVVKVIKIAADITNVKVPILEVKDVITSLASGDLTREFRTQSEGYVKEMGDELNTAIRNLNSLLGDINESSNLLATSSEQMLTKSDQMQGTTEQVASAIGQMAEGVQDQARQIDESSKLIDGVRGAAETMGVQAETINKAAKNGQANAKRGLETVKRVVESMGQIQGSADITSKSIDVLTERSEEIARTLNVITDIAGQTNLLALNAAIEAARAGDAGRGFAVVAEEIRKLAEDSRASAGDIEKVIKAVEKDISQAGKAINEMGDSVKSGNEASKEAETVFMEIDDSIIETLGLSEEVLTATESQKRSIDETVKNIEKIVVVSEETSSGTEEIATSSKDLSNGMNEFNSSSKGLADIANQLQDGVSKFKLKFND